MVCVYVSDPSSKGQFEFLDDMTTADIAFRAMGETLESLFEAAGRATTAVMVDPASIRPSHSLPVELEADTIEGLLFKWIEELIFQKDARQMVFDDYDFSIVHPIKWILKGTLGGEEISPERHEMRCDVKGLTLHQFELKQGPGGWETRIVLDV